MLTTSKAVRISSSHLLLQALDHRAGTYEKLDQLQAALRDSHQMLKLKPDSAKVCLEMASRMLYLDLRH